MPQVIVTILIWFASSLAFRVLAGAGLGIFSYVQIEKYMNLFINSVGQQLSLLPATFLQLLALAGFDKYLSICLSALTIATFIMTMKIFVGKSG